jgi:3-oxoacyl-[acyl-carrier protein] reductase
MELRGAVVVITGGGTGIGRATAHLFAEKGSMVIVCGRRSEPLEETVRLIEQRGGNGLALPVDVRESCQVRELADEVSQRFGTIDVLVNNAGVAMSKPILETSETEWDDMLDVNLKGVFLCCRAVLPMMIRNRKGVIINVSSILGLRALANFGAYSASKFGVIGLTQALAKEIKGRDIFICAVCPNLTSTNMQTSLSNKRISRLSMPPDKVAEKILDLTTGEIALESGGALVIDEQSPSLVLYMVSGHLFEVVKWYCKPFLNVFRRMMGK